jgi:transposase
MDIRALLLHIRANPSNRRVQQESGVDRRTVKRYRQWAESQGLLKGDLPALSELQSLLDRTLPEPIPPQNVSSVEPYRSLVERLVKEEVETAAIRERIKERGYRGTYAAVYRFVQHIKPSTPKTYARVERKPGEEVQVDFGYAGYLIDPESGKPRKAWAFVMLLSWSRHQYVEFVWDQSIVTWLLCHQHAFEYFGGVPKRVVLDNLKAAIIKACFDDPGVQQSYRECAEHYGFLMAPCQVRTPEHKGKVEQGGVHYVKRNFLGGREMTTRPQANRDVLIWGEQTAGQRIHGTTKEKPLERFDQVEKALLKPLPKSAYDLAVWKQTTLGRDCYVEFDHAYYSVPHRLNGQALWVCGGLQQVRIYTAKHELVATHERAKKAGERHTHPDHLPPEKLPGLMWDHAFCLESAAQVGAHTLKLVQTLLDDPVIEHLPRVIRLLKLRTTYNDQHLEAACERALYFNEVNVKTVKRILKEGLENQPLPVHWPIPPAVEFVRTPAELVGHLLAGEPWN